MPGSGEMRTDITGPPSKEPPSYSACSEIRPEEYADWRNSPLGMITERIEQKTVFDLFGDLRGKRVLDLGCGDGSYSILAGHKEAHGGGWPTRACRCEILSLRAAFS